MINKQLIVLVHKFNYFFSDLTSVVYFTYYDISLRNLQHEKKKIEFADCLKNGEKNTTIPMGIWADNFKIGLTALKVLLLHIFIQWINIIRYEIWEESKQNSDEIRNWRKEEIACTQPPPCSHYLPIKLHFFSIKSHLKFELFVMNILQEAEVKKKHQGTAYSTLIFARLRVTFGRYEFKWVFQGRRVSLAYTDRQIEVWRRDRHTDGESGRLKDRWR